MTHVPFPAPGLAGTLEARPRDGAARPGGDRRLLHGRRGHQRHPVHDPAPRPGHRAARAAGVLRSRALPAVLAGLAYAILASAMPRAGGSYVYASRGLEPVPRASSRRSRSGSRCGRDRRRLVRARAVPARHRRGAGSDRGAAASLETGRVRLAISLGVLWAAAGVNLRGVKAYERLIVPLMFLTFALGARGHRGRVLASTMPTSPRRCTRAADARCPPVEAPPLTPVACCCRRRRCSSPRSSASTRSRRRAAKRRRPGRNLPLAIGIAVGVGRRVLHAVHRGGVPRGAVAVHRRPRRSGATSRRRGCSGICCRRSGRW